MSDHSAWRERGVSSDVTSASADAFCGAASARSGRDHRAQDGSSNRSNTATSLQPATGAQNALPREPPRGPVLPSSAPTEIRSAGMRARWVHTEGALACSATRGNPLWGTIGSALTGRVALRASDGEKLRSLDQHTTLHFHETERRDNQAP